MGRRSNNFELVLLGGAFALLYFFHTIFNILFEEWIKHKLQDYLGITVAEMIERFGAITFPALGAIAVVWGLYRYIERELTKDAFEFVYDQTDNRFFQPDDKKAVYRVGLHIVAPHTIQWPNVRVLDSPFTHRVIAPRHTGRPHPVGAVQIYSGGAIDPGCLELFELCDLPPHRKYIKMNGDQDPLGHIQTFALEARGRDVRPARALFEYDPDKSPMIRRLS